MEFGFSDLSDPTQGWFGGYGSVWLGLIGFRGFGFRSLVRAYPFQTWLGIEF